MAKISILKYEGIIEKSYECHVYESVDDRSLSKTVSQKTAKKKKKTHATKRLNIRKYHTHRYQWLDLELDRKRL